LGHREKIEAIREQLRGLGRIDVIGNWLEGVAVKDCVRVAHACAIRLGQQ
jgi:protoporphyrinogen oxidase